MGEKKINRPSLKNFLSTGKVTMVEVQPTPEVVAEKADFSWLPKILSHDDLETWGGIVDSGAPFSEEKLDFIALRERFRTMDRVQFTLYILEAEGIPLRMIRSGVQIREPFVLFILWDDNGSATIYR